MSSSSSQSLTTWSVQNLRTVLPLDDDSLRQVVEYSLSLNKTDAAAHLGNILGESAPAFEFIAGFNERRDRSSRTGGDSGCGGKGKEKGKGRGVDQGKTANAQRRPVATSTATGPATSKNTKPPSSGAGYLVSDKLTNPKAKTTAETKKPRPQRNAASASASASASTSPAPAPSATTTKTNNIADLTAAIAQLELTTNPTLSSEKRKDAAKCNCNGSIHPVFTTAPNCLNCGKIICALEGLQPCGFCGTPLLSTAEVQDMIRTLRVERGNEKQKAHNEGQAKFTGSGPGPGPAALSSSSSSSRDEVANQTQEADGDGDPDGTLQAAKAHRDRLLSFQAHNARRTQIHDESADFETLSPGSTQWMSPAQRALALKRQQRIMRELDEKNKPEWERKSMVLSLDVKKGKVVRMVDSGQAGTMKDEELEAKRAQDILEEEKLQEDILSGEGQDGSGSTGGALGKNPLLSKGGLIRPVWRPKVPENHDSAQPGGGRRKQNQTWRMVQEDDDDNERWILDGGIHGTD